ncbi:beta-N-acetylhexosaminidase [Rhizomicrobium electricum]|uniref:beta-N-acetylhexosaminidase n=1 Tax=Rhizomicrobium electricum TaxID=480070 RepID=A0ABP3NZ02_9PROT|nr:beta-N-acetylhexosaminidase [Rhizomicrobium electricum]NIJ47373.1 beta-N-acetylhexosaminidase [Rhizomicrobium electricum]
MRRRVIFGCSGPVLEPSERDFFRDVQPWGFILFGRNVKNREQVRALTDSLRETVGDAAAPVLIDQEGGRVARLRPPEWPARPPQGVFGTLHREHAKTAADAAYLNARLIACDLAEIGVNVDCLPVLDVPVPGAHDVIGDRAFSTDPTVVIELGRAVMDGLMDGGVLPVMKHAPGHGRAGCDTHLDLPRVTASREQLSAADFVTFRSLAHCPMAMTAHVVYEAIDPNRPGTLSPRVVHEVIRGEIGYQGLLMTDDLSMQALSGPLSARAKAALFAGCDVVLHCNGGMDEMKDVATEAKPLEGEWLKRAETALGHLRTPVEFDRIAAEARLKELLVA